MKDKTNVRDQISFVLNGKPLVPNQSTQEVDSLAENDTKLNDTTTKPTENYIPTS